jgi:glucose uptake protein
MFIVNSYTLAIVLCVVTMLCWGSWGNTQKLAGKTWRYELFYWDYVIGILVFSLLIGFTFGSIGSQGRPFVTDLCQVAPAAVLSALVGGIVFNASNILLSASISLAGLAVAFPLGVGLALVLGVFNTYFFAGGDQGNPVLIFLGVALIVVALVLNGIASAKKATTDDSSSKGKKGIILAIISGILMSTFYAFVARAMDLDNFASPAAGKATPYTAFFIFAVGIFISNFLFNTLVMKKPFAGEPVKYSTYFQGKMSTHLVGVLGGFIWGLGTVLSYVVSGKAGASISYALGQGAPMISAFWGLFIWKEFKGSNKTVYTLLTLMFVLFIVGLGMIVAAK